MGMPETEPTANKHQVWNAGKTVGAKRVLKPKQIWEIRFYLNQRRRLLDRALFDLAINSKQRNSGAPGLPYRATDEQDARVRLVGRSAPQWALNRKWVFAHRLAA